MRYQRSALLRPGAVFLLSSVLGAGCTLQSQDPPELTGPSDFGRTIIVAASPDVLTQDGISQSVITVTARGPNSEPLGNVSLNAEIRVGGARADFGSLSARNIVTGPDGRGTFVYTAPKSPPLSLQEETLVAIVVIPVGTDFANAWSHLTTIRVVPVGPVVPPDGLAPYFTFTPNDPVENQRVLFQACADPARACAPADNPIAEYDWSFGDGNGGSSQFETHAYDVAGSYTVTLRVTDEFGRSASTVQQVTVGGGSAPTAAFVFSPTTPAPNQTIAFNATASTAPAGREIVQYMWDFGDGKGTRTQSSPIINYSYATAGEYNVTLVVTDDAGKTSSITVPVSVETP